MNLFNRLHPQQSSISLKDQVDFLNRLTKLLNHHFTLRRSLEFMLYDPKFSDLAEDLVNRLQQGQSIDQSFRDMNFHPMINAFLYFSSESGHMTEQLIQCHNMLKLRLDFQKKAKDITKYPLILLTFSLVIFFCMSLFLLPIYNETLNSFSEGSSYVWFNLFVSIFQTIIVAGIPLLFVVMIISILIYRRLPIDQQLTVLERAPFIRRIVQLSTTAQFAFHLGAILHNGKTVKSSLLIMSEQTDLRIISHYAKLMLQQLKQGQTLPQSAQDIPLIEPDFKRLIHHSLQQGSLNNDLKAYASIALSSLEERTRKLIMTLQPILYSLLAIMIVIVYVLTLFPMFQLINHL
ncbi:type II secretory pathway component PulF [Alkalibacillus flavidus]|uniref:Type II secretory pathway component PulF n=1 Tax=Alkalibacillus flavidus TaxID=546021 RepID=A0ABV2KXI1_9BACI